MVRDEVRYESHGLDTDYDVLIVAYGTVARVCLTAIEELAEEGLVAQRLPHAAIVRDKRTSASPISLP